MVSIIIPVYNVRPYLQACGKSIAEITAFSWEAILVDDGSTDGSGELCDDIVKMDQRFRVVHQTNGGVSVARNAGIVAAKGEWLWFVDADDTVNPDFEIVNGDVMQSADYVMFDMRNFSDGMEPVDIGHQCAKVHGDELSKNDFLSSHVCYHHQRLFYKKSLVMVDHHQRLKFSAGITVGEDLEFQYKYLTLCKRPVRLSATLYNYRIRKGSATQDGAYRTKCVRDLPVVLTHLLQWCTEQQICPQPWLEMRLQTMFQNYIYSASLVKDIDKQNFQLCLRQLLSDYQKAGFSFPKHMKMRLAYHSVESYFMMNHLYLKIRHRLNVRRCNEING